MNANYVFVAAVGIGFVAGLRTFTAPALVSWGAYLGAFQLHDSPLSFMGSSVAVALLSLLAIGEYIIDLMPKTPRRTKPGPLMARLATGGLSGACVCASARQSLLVGAVLGAIGGVIGAFAGYEARTRLVSGLKVKDRFIAIPEDLVAIGLGYLMVFVR
ncbi:MAG: DUF4126 family protein [Acidobacteriota bacterium]